MTIVILILMCIVAAMMVHYIIVGAVEYKVMVKPSKPKDAYAKKVAGMKNIIDDFVAADGNILQGYIWDNTREDNAIIFFGGREEAAEYSLTRFNAVKSDTGLYQNYDIIAVNWPGFGDSTGKATIDSMKSAAVNIAEEFGRKYKNNVIMGYSMGTGYATYAASKCKDICKALVLIAPYNEASDLVNKYFPVYVGPFKKFQTYRLNVCEFARHADKKLPVIITASEEDRIIPYKSSRNLMKNFGNEGRKLFVTVKYSKSENPEHKETEPDSFQKGEDDLPEEIIYGKISSFGRVHADLSMNRDVHKRIDRFISEEVLDKREM